MCWEIQPDEPNPVWKETASLPNARVMPDSVMLPDGKILYLNGQSKGMAGGNAGQVQYAQDPVHAVDLYDPETDTYTSMVLNYLF